MEAVRQARPYTGRRRSASDRRRRRPPAADNGTILDAAAERLETLSSLYDSLGLRASTAAMRKAIIMDKAAKTAAAAYFGTPVKPGDGPANYRDLLVSSLRGVRMLKTLKDRVAPAAAEPALSAVRDFTAEIDAEIAGRKLTASPPSAGKEDQSAGKPASLPRGGEDLENQSETLVSIAEVTFALSSFRKETGRFPEKLSDLVPKYIPAIPTIAIAGHTGTNGVTDIDSADYDADVSKALKDSGAWIYFSNKRSSHYGKVLVDCTHKNAQGTEFYRIGSAGQ
ncbi:MAG TPA: hypothetical protein PL037_04895 [Elusimicrobiales bacterium]|nr:hypothetical protein [Elusimicrobiales bacterium]